MLALGRGRWAVYQKPKLISNSLKQYHKKCMKNSEENMDVDTGALKGFISVTLLWLPLPNSHLVNCPRGTSIFAKISLKWVLNLLHQYQGCGLRKIEGSPLS